MLHFNSSRSCDNPIGHNGKMTRRFGVLLAALLGMVHAPLAMAYPSQSDGTDGALVVGAGQTVTVDLKWAKVGNWLTTPGGDNGGDARTDGVYDPEQWAVVFKYSTIDIAATGTIKFLNHPKGAPVVWLAQGNVTISGTVDLNGKPGMADILRANGGPGGFAGGLRQTGSPEASAGEGPGGGQTGDCFGAGGGYGEVGLGGNAGGIAYGSPTLLPLIGGSGGGGYGCGGGKGGGGGGGAILIASSGIIRLETGGVISAEGGEAQSGSGGDGSGGGVRLIADEVSGGGVIRARSGTSASNFGVGRIRIETLPNGNQLNSQNVSPMWSHSSTQGSLFPAANIPTNSPSLRIASIASSDPSADPFGGFSNSEDVLISKIATPVAIVIEAKNVTVPANTTVQARIVPAYGAASTQTSGVLQLVGTNTYNATLNATIPPGRAVIQLRLVIP